MAGHVVIPSFLYAFFVQTLCVYTRYAKYGAGMKE